MSCNIYRDYSEIKGWTGRFSYSDIERRYFAGEFAGYSLAGAEVLDIGFGDGAFMAWAKDNGANVSGTEIDSTLIEKARESGYTIYDANIKQLTNSQSGTFDVITAFDVLEHLDIEEIIRVIGDINALLKASGYLFIRTPNGQSPFGRVHQYGDITHKTVLSVDKFRQLAPMTGFELIAWRNSYRIRGPGWVRSAWNSIRFLGRDFLEIATSKLYGFERLPFDLNITVILQKN